MIGFSKSLAQILLVFSFVFVCLFTVSCGQKGDLYLPQSKNPANHKSSSSSSAVASSASSSAAAQH